MSDNTPWLHICSQFTWHGEASIVGTRDGLLSLSKAIGSALDGGTGTAEACASDGEGYEIEVRRTAFVSGLGKPTYIDEMARDAANYERTWMRQHSKSDRAQAKEALEALRYCRANGNPHLAKDPTP